MIHRLSELRGARPTDLILRGLVEVLQGKLELRSRLPVLVFECAQDGQDEWAEFLREFSATEDRQIAALLHALQRHLEESNTEYVHEPVRNNGISKET
jgi:hypothetical protein